MVAPAQIAYIKVVAVKKLVYGLMARFHPYKAVAKTVGLKTKKVKEVVEAMMEVAAIELKLVGSFKIANALSMKLMNKPPRKRKLVRIAFAQCERLFVCKAKHSRNVVKMRILKKFRLEMQKTCGDSSD